MVPVTRSCFRIVEVESGLKKTMNQSLNDLSPGILPFQSRFASVAGHRMHYLDEGSGPVAILLHGNPTWCYFYRNLIQRLKQNFRVIAPDFIGCGFSDRVPNKSFSAEERIEHLQELLNVVDVEKFSLVMHDWGGPIGTGLAVRNVDRLERLVYFNTTITEIESLPFFIKWAAAGFIGKCITMYTSQFIYWMTRFGVAKKLPHDVRDKYFLPYSTPARRQAIWDFVADIPFSSDHPTYRMMMEMATKLQQLQRFPVKIIWGLKDPCFHRRMLSKVAQHFPQAEVQEIPDASHLVLEDAPNIAIPAVEEFLLRDRAPTQQSNGESAGSSSARPHAIYEAFRNQVARSPLSKAAVIPESRDANSTKYSALTFADLQKLTNQYQRGLAELGLAPGDRALMLVQPGADFLALSLAVMGCGATPVFIDPGIGFDRLCKCIQDADPDIFIGAPRAQLLRFIRGSLFKKMKFRITASDFGLAGGHTLSFLKRFSSAPVNPVPFPEISDSSGRSIDIGMIAFTSGATGTPKGVVFTNNMLRAQLEIFEKQFGLTAGKIDLPLLPIFSLFTVALGVASVFVPLSPGKPLALDPDYICRVINDLGITSSFGSPTLWRKISEYCVRSSGSLPTLQSIFMAGAPVSREILDLVKRAAPNCEAYTPYGATEALPVTLVSGKELVEQHEFKASSGELGTYVGRILPGIDSKVIKATDAPLKSLAEAEVLADGQIGELIVRGANISPAYLHRPDANKRGKIPDESGVWHRMGDLVYRAPDGGIYFCGRCVHSVYGAAQTFHSVPIEMIFDKSPKVRRSALIGLGGGNIPAIVIEPHPQYWPESDAAKEIFIKELKDLAKSYPIASGIDRFLFHRSFPVDPRHNAKIYRDQLSVWADQTTKAGKAA